MQTWRLISDEPMPAALNMGIDEAIATACRIGRSSPTLRLYQWKPAALSLGYFQNAQEEVDQAQLKASGYTLVRRITGGRAVLHDQELTYSIAAGADDPLFSSTLRETFFIIAKGLISGLKRMGIEAQVLGQKKGRRPYASSPSCFTTALGYEIGVRNKKLIGSAQRRWKDGFLQHGSILYAHHAETLPRLLKLSLENQNKMAAHLQETATTICDLLKQKPEISLLRTAIREGMEAALQIRLIPSPLSPFEKALAQKLAQEKYGTDDWNLAQHTRVSPSLSLSA